MNSQSNIRAILEELGRLYPGARPALRFTNPFETLIATMLSAQTTDKQVNRVTEKLFPRFPDAFAMAALTPEQLEEHIRGCGVYRNKAKNIVATCKILVDTYGGRVPDTMEELLALPGVGRKTADVVLANAFGRDAIAVDTHVFRVSNRLGLAQAKDVLRTEMQLMENIPKPLWSEAHLWIINHGRQVCSARKPKCAACTLRPYCPSAPSQALQDPPASPGGLSI